MKSQQFFGVLLLAASSLLGFAAHAASSEITKTQKPTITIKPSSATVSKRYPGRAVKEESERQRGRNGTHHSFDRERKSDSGVFSRIRPVIGRPGYRTTYSEIGNTE